jgi:hypothetical protein
LDGISKVEVARRLPTPEADVLRAGFEQHNLHILRTNLEWVKILHHGSVQFSLRLAGATHEQNNLDPREAFPGGKRRQIIAGRMFDETRQWFVVRSSEGLDDRLVYGFQERDLLAIES